MGLLYDALMYKLWQHGSRAFDAMFGKTAVFEMSNCIGLISELSRTEEQNAKAKIPPRRPPNPLSWFEFTEEKPGLSFQWAVLLVHDPRPSTIVATQKSMDVFRTETGQDAHFRIEAIPFARINRSDFPPPFRSPPQGMPFILNRAFCIFLDAGWRHHAIVQSDSTLPGLEGIPTAASPESEQVEMGRPISVALFACSLLHCHNIEAEEIKGPPLRPREIKRGQPGKTSYRVLRLNLPSTLRPKGEVEESDEEKARMRLHLCRGHFKNLQHPRFKNKGWHWWPAHWRGDPELGTADKTYEGHPAKPEES